LKLPIGRATIPGNSVSCEGKEAAVSSAPSYVGIHS
jgi:hypothetical protein